MTPAERENVQTLEVSIPLRTKSNLGLKTVQAENFAGGWKKQIIIPAARRTEELRGSGMD